MGEAHFRLIGLLGYLENNFRAIPLGLIFGEIQVAVQDKPDDPLAGNQFSDPLFRIMDVFVPIRKLLAEFVGASFNFSLPPSANVIDGGECLFRSLV